MLDWRDTRARDGGAVWARRGNVFAVLASGNGPGVHGLWPQALALGYRVAVRPSRREPLTAHRLIHALQQNGFRPHDAVYLPTDHRGADEMIRSADLAMVYGGQDVVDKYADDPTVFVNGPGRAKILITADHDWRDYLDTIVDSIADLGGVACVNTTAVLYEGDSAPLAAAIAERLSTIDNDVLPTQSLYAATALAGHLAGVAPAAPRYWAPIRSSPHSATVTRRCARPCTCWLPPTWRSSMSNCRSHVSGWRRGRVPTGLTRCGIRW